MNYSEMRLFLQINVFDFIFIIEKSQSAKSVLDKMMPKGY